MLKPGISAAVPLGASTAFGEDADASDRELDGIADDLGDTCPADEVTGERSFARGEALADCGWSKRVRPRAVTRVGALLGVLVEGLIGIWLGAERGRNAASCASSEDGARLVVAGAESEDFIEVTERRARSAARIAGIEPRADRCAWNRQPSSIGIPVRHARKKRKWRDPFPCNTRQAEEIPTLARQLPSLTDGADRRSVSSPSGRTFGKECLMSQQSTSAQRLVLHAMHAVSSCFEGVSARSSHTRQELPTLDLVGAAIARASRIAAARARAAAVGQSSAHPTTNLAHTQAAGLLKPSLREMDALFADLAAEEGEPLLPTPSTGGRVWRLHRAPSDSGAALASAASTEESNALRSTDGFLGAGA